MKKRLLSLLLVLALFLSLLPAAALAEEGAPGRGIIGSGDCGAEGDNVTWTLYDDGRLVISGAGEMAGDDPSPAVGPTLQLPAIRPPRSTCPSPPAKTVTSTAVCSRTGIGRFTALL